MTTTIQERKLHIIQRLTTLQDEQMLQLIENLLFDEEESLDDEPLTDSEKGLLQERIADYHANPNDETSWDEVKKQMKTRYGLRS
jgi:putative addiction module component (TIGR02574 family)